MKKTSIIILTLVASVSISLGSAQTNPSQNVYPPEFLFESEVAGSDTTKYDTLRSDTLRSDTTRNYNQQTNVYYDYYYQNRFYNGLFRIFFPGRYYRLIGQPGYVPRHLRSYRSDGLHAHSGKRPSRGSSSGRGGFGHSGLSHSQFN